jgi:hypothetical protein
MCQGSPSCQIITRPAIVSSSMNITTASAISSGCSNIEWTSFSRSICINEMGSLSVRSYPGTEIVRDRVGGLAGRARWELELDRNRKFGGYDFGLAYAAPPRASSTPRNASGCGLSYPVWAELKIRSTWRSRPRWPAISGSSGTWLVSTACFQPEEDNPSKAGMASS